ncbi:MAG: electron transfer flavoprotein subunit beta/FixA family protein [Flavobacteriales bacterium]|nr:electron transfer flavoprotein subunit beta/FixA family protein [Flavobacteriales bacterium]
MKILVCISKAPDTTSRIAFTDNNTAFDQNGVQFIVNPYDEWYALVRALELKEAQGGSVTTITVGGADNDPIIRKALAIGADDAVRVDAEALDSLAVAKYIANYASANGYDLVMCGKETIDYNGAVVGGMVAELMDVPYVSLAIKLDVNGSVATLEREAQGGTEIVEASLPLVISASKGMAEQRIPNMRGIMAARTKPLQVVASEGINASTKVVRYELPPAKAAVKLVSADNVAELVDLLHNEAKVI